MEKQRSSTDHHVHRILAIWALLALLPAIGEAATPVNISKADAVHIGKRIWQNECNGTIAGLTSWNSGEDFASLGIGHFIWYPKGMRGPFEESFPQFLEFARQRNATVPVWLNQATFCPWSSRAEFSSAQNSAPMRELRQFLAETVDLQAQFLIARLQGALPKMLAEAPSSEREAVEQNFHRVASSAAGRYALVDYVNFKGEGVLPTERYKDEGWGLLQVLSEMRAAEPDTVKEFSRAASAILRRRVANSPPERHEAKWLPGWLNRVNSYSRG